MFKSNLVVMSVALALVGSAGCMPSMSEKRIAKPRSSKEAAGRWNSVRGSYGQSQKVKYKIDGEEFEVLWEATRVIGGTLKMQMQPPKWDQAKVYRAAEIAFAEEPNQPWFYPIEDTFLPCIRQAMAQIGERKSEKTGRSIGITPDMPYDCSVKVIERENGWFVECVARLIPDFDPTAG